MNTQFPQTVIAEPRIQNSTDVSDPCMVAYLASFEKHGNMAMATAAYARRWEELKSN